MSSPIRVPQSEFAQRKAVLASIRERAKTLFQAGSPGIQIATVIAEATDQMLLNFLTEICEKNGFSLSELAQQGSLIAVGGTGRGELAPYSDVDLLFLHEKAPSPEFLEVVKLFVQTCWDAGIQLGHAVRDIPTCLNLAKQEPQIATGLVEARLLWGNQRLHEKLVWQFKRKVVDAHKRQFIETCLEARSEGWTTDGPLAQELEPDIKASSGGLRDLHLIRWIGYARYGVRDIDSLRLKGALNKNDAKTLKDAWEFLTRLRIDLHLSAGRVQDRLTRDEQLRIARDRGFMETSHQRPVEIFMQEYFEHSSKLATITRRFAAIERPRSAFRKCVDLMVGHRAEGILYVGADQIEVKKKHLPLVCENLETMLRLYKTAALYDVPLAPQITEAFQEAIPQLEAKVTEESARLFLEIFRCTRSLGPTLRSMFTTGLLDLVIPDVTHVRNLLQFNQYHHFTVDEHTLRAVEAVTGFENDQGPIGEAYRAIRHKEVLHLAVLLHDLGKGFEEDHCIIGEQIGLRIGHRLFLPLYQIEQIALLVRKHLEMADLAFRRDITDAKLVLNFSRGVGSPDVLRMLYTLTAADVTAVGPGTWTNWKAGLLAELFDRCMVILSGKRYSYHEEERLNAVKSEVVKRLNETADDQKSMNWINETLQGFSSYYLSCTSAEQIAEDLHVIAKLAPNSIDVLTSWNKETGATEYRIITRNPLAIRGCFHKMCGVLAAKRMEVLSADINTTDDGVVVDSYRVIDPDYRDEPPPERFEEVAETFRDVLEGRTTVESLFIKHRRYGSRRAPKPVSDLPTRVRIDNDSSEERTIIDVFAHDRLGLLYTVATTLYDLGLSIDMAKIATHFDQVVDVFYVQEQNGDKVRTSERIGEIQQKLMHALDEFDTTTHRNFINGA